MKSPLVLQRYRRWLDACRMASSKLPRAQPGLASQGQEGTSDIDLDQLTADFTHILESANCALRRGYGFIEAAEVYSAILGRDELRQQRPGISLASPTDPSSPL